MSMIRFCEVYSIFGRQTSQREIADIIRNKGQIALELSRLEKGQGLEGQLKTANDTDVTQNIRNLQVAWDNLLYSLSNSETVISVLKALTDGIRSLDSFSRTNPEIIKQLGLGLGILGAFLLGAGGVAIIAALGPAGWFVLGLGALGAEFAVFGKQMFDLKSAVSWITFGPFTPLVKSLYDLGTWVEKFGNTLALFDWKKGFDALISGLQSLWDKIKSFFSGDGSPYNPSAPFGPAQHMNYEGGTPVLTPASYTTTSYSSAAKAVASSPMGNFSGADIAAGVNGNAYIAARRARFAQELKDPNTRLQFAAMMLSEDAKNPIPVAEFGDEPIRLRSQDADADAVQQVLWSDQSRPVAVLHRKAATRSEVDGKNECCHRLGSRWQQRPRGTYRSRSTQRPEWSLGCCSYT